MLPDRVSNPGPLAYESGALPIANVSVDVLLYDCYLNIVPKVNGGLDN